MKKFTAEFALLFITIIWGATFVIIKSALQDISPMLFISLRFITAALILLIFLKKIIEESNKGTIYGGLLLGALYFLGFSTQTAGLNYTSATKSGFITGTFVIFIPIFQLIIDKRMPGRGNILGIFLVLFGLILLSSKGESFFNIFKEIGTNFNIGDFLTLICAIFFALYIVYLDIISKKHDYMPLVFFQIVLTSIAGLLFLFIFSFLSIEQIKFTFNTNVLFALLYTSLLATVLASILQTRFQKVVTPAKAGIIFSFEPIFAALFAFFTLNEKISNFGLLGCLFIFAGLLASEVIDKNKMEMNNEQRY